MGDLLREKQEVVANFTILLDDVEAAALVDIFGYGVDKFLEVFYKHLGKAYLEKHEQGVYGLAEIAKELKTPLADLATARKYLDGRGRDESN